MTVTALEYIQAELLNLRASRRDLFVPLPSPIRPIVAKRRRPISVVAKSELLARGRIRQTAQKRKAVTSVTNCLNSGADCCAKRGEIRPADRRIWLTLLGLRFTRPACHRGRSRYFTFVHREHMPTRQIAMHKCAVWHYTYNCLSAFAIRCRNFLIVGFAVGLALFQGGYSDTNYLPISVDVQQRPCGYQTRCL